MIYKSIGTILAGFVGGALLSILTDFVLEATGVITGPDDGLFITWMIVLVLTYRCVYTIASGFIVARLAPGKPMLHAMILGAFGVVLTVLGSSAKADRAPLWFGFTLAALTLPSLWLGVKIAESRKT